MLEVVKATDLRLLADRLGEALSKPQADPFSPEWLAVPSAGIRFWLARELAGRIGATGGNDGVCANVEFVFPGNLRREVLNASHGDEVDPWAVETLVWHVLEEVAQNPEGMPLSLNGEGEEPLYASARHVADLFDRYHHYRPGMIHSWLSGQAVDGAGQPTGPETEWQPLLWSRLHRRIGSPSPPERMAEALDAARSGELDLDLPERIAFFGHATLPGGPPFLDLASAVAAGRDVTLYLWQPSSHLGTSEAVWDRGQSDPSLFNSRAQRPRSALIGRAENPLLRSWAGSSRETAVLLADAQALDLLTQQSLEAAIVESGSGSEARSLLGAIQQDLRADGAPAGDFVAHESDRSVQFHSCQGPTRQVEVLRDVILHLLESDPAMTEDDIVVVCPAVEDFAPLIQGVFGRSAFTGQKLVPGEVPAIRYRITDRSLDHANPVAEALTATLATVAGRFEITRILDLIANQCVADRFGFSEDALNQISDLVEEVTVRWGKDSEHRAKWGLEVPEGAPYEVNTWRHGIDRLLAGAATLTGDGNDESEVVAGDVLPFNLETSGLALAGRLADVLHRIGQWEELTELTRTPAEWMAALREGVGATFHVPATQRWQMDSVLETFGEIEQSVPEGSTVTLNFSELQRLLAERLGGISARAEFFRGGVTISSTTPLRGVPFKAVIMLGMDQERITQPFADADDLMARAPLCGDRDPRNELRLELLGAVMSAESHLVVIRDGKDAKTNQPIPPSVPVAELMELVQQTCEPSGSPVNSPGLREVEVHHGRHGFDEGDLREDPRRSGLTWKGPWTFDPSALSAANARRERRSAPGLFCPDPLPEPEITEIDIADLRKCLGNPVKWFLESVLEVSYPRSADVPMASLPIRLSSLDTYAAGNRLLKDLLSNGNDPEDIDGIVGRWIDREMPRGQAGPPALATIGLKELSQEAVAVADAARASGFDSDAEPGAIELDVNGVRIHGHTADPESGDSLVSVRFTRPKDKDEIESWVDLMAFAATNGRTGLGSVCVRRNSNNGTAPTVRRRMVDDSCSVSPADALALAVDLYRRSFRDPIPLLDGVSKSLAVGGWPDWPPRYPGEATVVLGHLELQDLLAIPPNPWDPDPRGEESRVQLFADLLWGAIGGSQIDPSILEDLPGTEDPATLLAGDGGSE